MANEPGPLGQGVSKEVPPAGAANAEDANPGWPESGGSSTHSTPGSPSSQTTAPLPMEDVSRVDDGATLARATLAGRRPGGPGGGFGRRSRSAYPGLTTGSIPRGLWRLSWPQMLESTISVADALVDLLWAGRLPGGFRAIAGVGVAQTFAQFGMMARMGLDQSMRAMVARAVGAGNIPLANHVTLQAFALTGIYSLLMVLIGILLTNAFLRFIGASEAVKSQTAMYMQIQFIGMATTGFRMASGAALQSAGDVITPLKATTVSRLLHVVITPFLMFGWWGFPTMGLPGAALSNVLAQLAGCVITFAALFRGSSYLHLSLRGYRVDYALLWRIIKIGTPASIAGTERAVSQLVLLRFVSPFGDVALAGYALARRLEMFSGFASGGFGMAAGTMAGQNLGAGRPDRARQSVAWALFYVSATKAVLTVLVFLYATAIVEVFSSDADVVELTTVWLRIQVIAAVFMAWAMVFQQTYNTAGDTMAPLVVTLLTVWAVEVPLAWLVSFGMDVGPLGIGYAAVAGMAARLVCYVPYFFWGRWLRVKVI